MAGQDLRVPPWELEQAALGAGLGNRRRLAKTKRLTKAGRLWPVVLALVVAGLLLPSGSYAAALIVTGAGLAVTVALQVVYETTPDRWLALHDHGLVHADKAGLSTLTWNDIDSVQRMDVRHYRNGVYTGTTHKTVVNPLGRPPITLNDKWEDVVAVSDDLQNEVSRTRLPMVVAAINSGQTVPFGAFTLHVAGIGYKGQQLTWDRVERISVAKGYLKITTPGQKKAWANARAVGMPNFPVFLTVAQAMGATIG
jgi:hypothetical protein